MRQQNINVARDAIIPRILAIIPRMIPILFKTFILFFCCVKLITIEIEDIVGASVEVGFKVGISVARLALGAHEALVKIGLSLDFCDGVVGVAENIIGLSLIATCAVGACEGVFDFAVGRVLG